MWVWDFANACECGSVNVALSKIQGLCFCCLLSHGSGWDRSLSVESGSVLCNVEQICMLKINASMVALVKGIMTLMILVWNIRTRVGLFSWVRYTLL